jgi:hypothetical protein
VVIGRSHSTDEQVDDDAVAILSDDRFRVFDLRGAPDVRGVGALATEVGEAVRLLLVDADTSEEWLHRLARAFLDGQDRIEFAEGSVEHPLGRSIVVVHYGAATIEDLPWFLREVIVQFPDRA